MNFILQPFSSHKQISQEIEKQNPQIVHFCCHGLENGSLELEKDKVSPQRLNKIIEISKDKIVCVFFNACNSAKAAEVISQKIDYVIGMEQSIDDRVAIEFAKTFYGALLPKPKKKDRFLNPFNQGIIAIAENDKSLKAKPILYKRISYNEAILNLIKQLDAEDKINDLLNKLKTSNFTNKLLRQFTSYYQHPLKNDLNEFQKIIEEIGNKSAIETAYQNIFPDAIESDKSEIIYKLTINDGNSAIPWQLFHGDGEQHYNLRHRNLNDIQEDKQENNKLKDIDFPAPPPWRKFLDIEKLKVPEKEEIESRWIEIQELADSEENQRGRERGEKFRIHVENKSDKEEITEAGKEVLNAVNAAIYLRRPLLVTGNPGSGKTSLAYAIR